MSTVKPSVLFVCVHNAGRSQMAAAYLQHLAEGQIEVRSAGSMPAEKVNPAAVQAMREEGIDMSTEIPKILTTEAVQASDVVITMGCGDTCPIFPGKRYEDWKLDDPAGQGVEAVRPIRDEIRARIETLIGELLPLREEQPLMITDHPILVIGAGPIGLATAAHLLERDQRVLVLESGDHAGAAMSQWAHIKLFSPWKYNVDAAARRLLETPTDTYPGDWKMPRETSLPTGGELVENYLKPLAAHPELGPVIRYQHHVTAVSRLTEDGLGLDKTRTNGREQALFLVRVQTPEGAQDFTARAVIDASGTWNTSNPVGRAGLSAPGEAEAHAQGRVISPLPDPLGADRQLLAGKTILVLGAGHSAANTLISLGRLKREHEDTQILWGIRGATNPIKLYGGGASDQLPARGQLGTSLRRLVDTEQVTLLENTAIIGLAPGERLHMQLADGRELDVDYLVPATGFRPDLGILSELRLDLDPAVEAPRQLGPLIDPEFQSCGTVSAHGEQVLAHPEPYFYIVGMKSYGRAPTFLMATGYEQVRSIAAHLAGDTDAATTVELDLLETGVCSTDLGGSCDAPFSEEASCCTGLEESTDFGGNPQQVAFAFRAGTFHGFSESQTTK